AAKATEVRVAHVVNNNKHDVGALRLFLGVSHQGKQGRQGELIFCQHSQIKLYLLYLLRGYYYYSTSVVSRFSLWNLMSVLTGFRTLAAWGLMTNNADDIRNTSFHIE
ncbi:MAG: hypothetical protein MR951_01760, partial [Paraprevotella sp.]|nr:hypothetical protein [Paraprevotella sp.]